MKRIITAILLILSIQSFGQTQPTGVPTKHPNYYYQFINYVEVDKGFAIPYIDTNWIAKRAGYITYRPADNKMYVSTGLVTGQKWEKIGGNPNSNIGGGYALVVPNTNDIKTLYVDQGIILDSGYVGGAIAISADTLTAVTGLATIGDITRAGNQYWSKFGNEGTDTSGNFVGTYDAVDFALKSNNLSALYVHPDGTIDVLRDMHVGGMIIGRGPPTLSVYSQYNTLFGESTGASNTGGGHITAIGYMALTGATASDNSTVVGAEALRYNTSGNNNAIFGAYAGRFLATGSQNTIIGTFAMSSGTTFEECTAVGTEALANNTGDYNSALGSYAMANNTTGYASVAIGKNSQLLNTTGYKNTTVGSGSAENNTTGSLNTFVGQDAGLGNTTGSGNVGIGWLASSGSQSADEVTSIGYAAGRSLAASNGGHNVFIGGSSGWHANQRTNLTRSIALGANSYTTKDSQFVVGAPGVLNESVINGRAIIFPDYSYTSNANTDSAFYKDNTGLLKYGKVNGGGSGTGSIDSLRRLAGSLNVEALKAGTWRTQFTDSIGSGGGSGTGSVDSLRRLPGSLNVEVLKSGTWRTQFIDSVVSAGVSQSIITDTLLNYFRTTGNYLTGGVDKFIGIVNNRSLRFRSNNIEHLLLDSASGGLFIKGDANSVNDIRFRVSGGQTGSPANTATFYNDGSIDFRTWNNAVFLATNVAGTTMQVGHSSMDMQLSAGQIYMGANISMQGGTAVRGADYPFNKILLNQNYVTLMAHGQNGVATNAFDVDTHEAWNVTGSNLMVLRNNGTIKTTISSTGYITTAAPSYSSGGYDLLVRNATSGRFETVIAPSDIIESTYTPTAFNTTNVAGSITYATTNYRQTGNTVDVWGEISIDASSALTITEIGFSLPVSSNLGTTGDLSGHATFEDNTTLQVRADITNDRAVIRGLPQTSTNNKYSITFTYKVIN